MSDVARAPGGDRAFSGHQSQALLLGASRAAAQHGLDRAATCCQRVRCAYFRDGISPCNKRDPGSGCAALDGINRGHAILGTSERCIATHPSDLAVALVALDAIVHTQGPGGERAIPVDDLFLLPGDTPHIEHPLERGELIVEIEVPASSAARTSLYLKVRDRESYEFALTSVAVALRLDDGDDRGGAAGTWRHCHEALARPPRGTAPDRRARDLSELRRAPRRRSSFRRRPGG